jgi:protochlorophyllide reductase
VHPDASSDPSGQSGRVFVITGANSGLGLAAAQALAARRATVVLACRSEANAYRTRDEILRVTPHADVQPAVVDISSLASVRGFAESMQRRFSSLDVLINNAGIMATPRALSADGYEMQFATNHLGHFALTGLLLPLLRGGRGSRVVAVSSIAARSGTIDFEDPMGERRYDEWKAYNQSKLANLMFALELQRRLARAAGSTVALAAHPGASTTNLFATPGGFFAKRILSPLLGRFLFQPAERGVLPILLAATSPAAQPGGYYGPDGFQEMKGDAGPAVIPPQALDEDVAARLWRLSEQLTGVSYP